MATKGVRLTPEVADILERSTIEGANVLKLPPGQLDRPLYEAVNKALQALGGKWDRKAQGHVFKTSPDQALAAALRDGQAVDRKRTLEQFFTPPDIAHRMALMADCDGEDVLEPSAGEGALVRAAYRAGAFSVTAIDIDPDMVSAMCSEFEGRPLTICADFLGWQPHRPETPLLFGAIVMNPPFSRNQDIMHVWQAFKWLKPWGRLVSVMSPHWTFAQDHDSREFRQALDRHKLRNGEDSVSWQPLPEGTFKQSGTGVSAGLFMIKKGG